MKVTMGTAFSKLPLHFWIKVQARNMKVNMGTAFSKLPVFATWSTHAMTNFFVFSARCNVICYGLDDDYKFLKSLSYLLSPDTFLSLACAL